MQGSPSDQERRRRFRELVDLVLTTRGWTKTEMGEAIGRDPTKIYPASGNPKMDYLVGLAEVLEWPVSELIDATQGTRSQPYFPSAALLGEENGAVTTGRTFKEAHRRAVELYRSGAGADELLDMAREMYALADTSNRRAGACIVAGWAWNGLGRYQLAADVLRHGLALTGVEPSIWTMLQINLASSLYAVWDLVPALGIAEFVVRSLEREEHESVELRKCLAFGHYVRGNTWRRLAALDATLADDRFEQAIEDLHVGAAMLDGLAAEIGDDNLRGIAHVCRGAVLECEVALGHRDAGTTVDEMVTAVTTEAPTADSATWREATGWWSIFASNVALRHLQGREMQAAMRTLLERTLEIADALDNWAMRERVLALRYMLHRNLQDATGLDFQLTIGERERMLLCPVMGRFPRFREDIGWTMIEEAKVVST